MKTFLTSLAMLISVTMFAQLSSEQLAVKAPIDQLFKGMQLGDSAMVHAAFTKNATFVSVMRNKSNVPMMLSESLKDVVSAIGQPHKEVWNEETWNYVIQIDGDFAQVWCDYGFYVDNTFSHCGVDTFHLFKGPNGWKIFHLADTRRKSNCDVPKDIKAKHGQ